MPLAEVLTVKPVFGLAGIERYPRVRSLRLSGPMEDLRPLATLRAVTFAELQGDAFRDVYPLTNLPELRWLRFETKRPEFFGDPELRASRSRFREHHGREGQLVEREHRFELRKSEGEEIDPEEFAAPPLDEDKVIVPAGLESDQPRQPWQGREIDPEDETFDPDAWRFDEEVDDWDFAVHFTGTLTEEAYIVQDYQAAAARYYLQRKPEKLKDAQR